MLESSGRSQRDIAEDAGFERPNVISMMKVGHMKVPIERAPALARACGADAAAFTRLVMAEYYPGVLETLAKELGAPPIAPDSTAGAIVASTPPKAEPSNPIPEPVVQITVSGRRSIRERFREMCWRHRRKQADMLEILMDYCESETKR